MNREQGMKLLDETRIVAIVRGVGKDEIRGVAGALAEGGIRVMEVTLNTPGALEMIESLQSEFGGSLYIGAGTVLDAGDAEQAAAAGASFIVTPNTEPEVIRYAADRNMPVFPGAMTPTEIVTAWRSGATAVKIFPGASLGLAYLKELQGPLNHIPMVAVGGVHPGNIADFLGCGCYAVGIGGSLVNPKEAREGQFAAIADKARLLVESARAHIDGKG